MTNFQITQQGNPTYPITIGIASVINVSQTLVNSVTISETQGTSAFDSVCQSYANNAENAYKTLPEFSVQDSNRNATYTIQSTGGLSYDITMSWTIENAELSLSASTQTDLQGQERTDLLQLLAESKVNEFKTQFQWFDL
jgi:hypothetical protein